MLLLRVKDTRRYDPRPSAMRNVSAELHPGRHCSRPPETEAIAERDLVSKPLQPHEVQYRRKPLPD
eukprot:2172885-Pyramimonas_sp.AAC.1